MMKTQIQKNIIIIVSAYSSGEFLAPLFNGRGYSCIHVTTRREWDMTEWRSYYRSEQFADNIIIDSDADIEKLVEKLKKHSVQLIIPGCESGVSLSDKLSQYFNVPKNDYTKSIARRNKFAMIDTIKNHGLLHADQMKSNNVETIIKWFDDSGFEKIVLKPLSSGSSDGVFYCKNSNEITNAFSSIYGNQNKYNETNHEVLAQQFLDGDEYIVNTVSRDGFHLISDIWKGVSEDSSLVSNDIYADYIFPDTEEHRILSEYVKLVLDALGIHNGPAHSEIRLTSRGPCLIETGARLAGKVDFSVIENICGVSQISLTAEALLEPEVFKARTTLQHALLKNKSARYVYFSSNKEGIIKKDPCFDDMLEIESLMTLYFKLGKGEALRKTSKAFRSPRPGYAYLVSTDLDKLEKDCQKLRIAESNLYTSLLSE